MSILYTDSHPLNPLYLALTKFQSAILEFCLILSPIPGLPELVIVVLPLPFKLFVFEFIEVEVKPLQAIFGAVGLLS